MTSDNDFMRLTGIITNGCANAAGPELKWTVYNSDGTVAFSQDFWPASTVNIAPRTNYPFEYPHAAPRGRWSYEVRVVSVDQW
ncbi:MAG TPA: hypothetical protein VNF29_02830 [Candidatus Binataceae bacterium]|nr:hypothetical protein [Candidatus Binataceae bacterium]